MATYSTVLAGWAVQLKPSRGVAYFMSGSELIKASVFESLGDVMSSAILAVTQMRVRDTTDMHLYPTGKKRFTPLGILFFSAFAVSTMISLIIENIEKLFGWGPWSAAVEPRCSLQIPSSHVAGGHGMRPCRNCC